MTKKSSAVSKAIKKPAGKSKGKGAIGVKAVKPPSKNMKGKPNQAQSVEQQLAQREDELAILNSVGEAMAKTLDVKTVTKIVGDKVRDIFNVEVTEILLVDKATNLIHSPYSYYKKYIEYEPFPLGKGLTSKVINSGSPILIDRSNDEATKDSIVANKEDETESYLGVPIVAGKEVIGVVSIQSYKQYAYNNNHLRLLQTLSANMGVAIQNARLFEAEQERVAELQIINSIQQGLAAELDFQAIVDLVGDKLREVFNTPDFEIRWYDEKTNLLHFLYVYQHGKRITIAPVNPPLGGVFDTLQKTRQPYVLNTKQEREKLAAYKIPDTDDGKSVVWIPIISSDRVRGLIGTQNFERENAYGESELRLLTTIAASLGTALENARLFNETQRLFKAEQERVAELAVINSVQEGLASKLDMQGIYDSIGDKIREIFDAQTLIIGTLDHQTKQGIFNYFYEKGERYYPEPIPFSGLMEHISKTGEKVVINENLIERGKEFGMVVAAGGWAKSGVWMPFKVGNQVSGIIALQNMDREHAFPESDVRLLETLANSMSVALENAHLFDETQRLLKETEDRAAEMAVINSIQQGLAAELDFQTIIDLVGDKLREVFKTPDLSITWYDEKANLIHTLYAYEHGNRLTVAPQPPRAGGMFETMVQTRQPIVFNSIADYEKMNAVALPGTDQGKSYVAVPIISSDRVLGIIGIENFERENAFGESELRLLTTIAASLGTALENARLFNETQQRNAELAIINSVQEGLASKLDMQAIYDLVGDKIRDIFDAQSVAIVSYDHKDQITTTQYNYEKGERFYPAPGSFSGPARQIISTRQPILNNHVTLEVIVQAGGAVTEGTEIPKSVILVPMIVGGTVSGMVTIQNIDRFDAFSDSDVRLLETLANSMSVALENARLFDETQQRNAELAIINSVQAALAAELNIQGIYDAVGDKIREIFNNTDMNIRILDPQTNTVLYPYMYENGKRLDVFSTPLSDKGFSAHVFRTRETVVINENLLQEEKKYGSFTIPGTESENSVVFVPLVAGEQVRGLINLASMEEHAFSESDVRLLQTLANSMSVALENARLFDETQRLLKETEQRAAELAIINSVQEGLASKLDMQAIFDLVGDKIQSMFNAQSVIISTFDHEKKLSRLDYAFEEGQRVFDDELLPFSPMNDLLISSRQTIVINRYVAQ